MDVACHLTKDISKERTSPEMEMALVWLYFKKKVAYGNLENVERRILRKIYGPIKPNEG